MIAGSSTETMPTGALLLGGLTRTSNGTLLTGQNLAVGTPLQST
ncbi:hypothetical protein [Motiliproteus sp. MSK22-1]|nr:hypothetical protein [Motiliproteus sp. MSK22-1]